MLGVAPAVAVTLLCLAAGIYDAMSAWRVRRPWPRRDLFWHASTAVIMIVTAWVIPPKIVMVALAVVFVVVAVRYGVVALRANPEACVAHPVGRMANGYHAAMMAVMGLMLGLMHEPAASAETPMDHDMAGMNHTQHATQTTLMGVDLLTVVAVVCAIAAAAWVATWLTAPRRSMKSHRAGAEAAMAAAMAVMLAAH